MVRSERRRAAGPVVPPRLQEGGAPRPGGREEEGEEETQGGEGGAEQGQGRESGTGDKLSSSIHFYIFSSTLFSTSTSYSLLALSLSSIKYTFLLFKGRLAETPECWGLEFQLDATFADSFSQICRQIMYICRQFYHVIIKKDEIYLELYNPAFRGFCMPVQKS